MDPLALPLRLDSSGARGASVADADPQVRISRPRELQQPGRHRERPGEQLGFQSGRGASISGRRALVKGPAHVCCKATGCRTVQVDPISGVGGQLRREARE